MWAAVALVAGLTALTPLAYKGSVWMRRATMGVAIVALANVSGHVGGSLLAGRVMPGAYSAPLLAVVGVYALVRAWRCRQGAVGADRAHAATQEETIHKAVEV